MTDPTVPPDDDAAKRSAFVADLLALATLLTVNPWAPVPVWAEVSEHLNDSTRPEEVVPALDKLRDLAARLGVEVDEHLNDRSLVVARFGSITYKLIAWHPAGRPGELDAREAELERLRAEVAELRAAAKPDPTEPGREGPWFEVGDRVVYRGWETSQYHRAGLNVVGMVVETKPITGSSPLRQQFRAEGADWCGGGSMWNHSDSFEPAPVADPTGLSYSRTDDADDPTPVSPARVPLHTGGVVDGGRLVDETPAESEGVFNGLPDCSPACERQVLTQDTKHLADCPRSVALIARFGTSKAGQPREPQAADTVPVPAEDATLTRLPEAEDETPVNLMDQTGPCVASLHIPAPGVACGICGAEGMRSAQHVQVDGTASSDGCEAECACGAVFAGDTPAEVRELLTRHVRQARSGAPSAKDLYA